MNFKLLSVKPVFLKTLKRDPKKTGHPKIPNKFTDVLDRNNSSVSVGFFFKFNVGGKAHFEKMI